MLSSLELARFVGTVADESGDHEEQGANIGTCNKYQKAGGGVDGDSWCMDLLIWALHEVTGKYPLPRSGSCEEQRVAARKAGTLGKTPHYGAIGLVINAAGRAHHAFVVASHPMCLPDGHTFKSWAGNTNNNGSNNGTGVYPKDRGGPADHETYEFITV